MEYIDDIVLQLNKLYWLNNSFGLARKMSHKGKYYPGILVGKEYKSMFPKTDYGNFSFIYQDDPIQCKDLINQMLYTIPLSIILWYDLSKIPNSTYESIKKDIIDNINQLTLTKGRFNLVRIYEKAENIYKGFNLSEQETQFAMYPYGAIRLECEIKTTEKC